MGKKHLYTNKKWCLEWEISEHPVLRGDVKSSESQSGYKSNVTSGSFSEKSKMLSNHYLLFL